MQKSISKIENYILETGACSDSERVLVEAGGRGCTYRHQHRRTQPWGPFGNLSREPASTRMFCPVT